MSPEFFNARISRSAPGALGSEEGLLLFVQKRSL